MSHHHSRNARLDTAHKRQEIDGFELFQSQSHQRQLMMRIFVGIAMSRKMFHTSHHTSMFHTFNKCYGLIGNCSWIFAKSTETYNRILWIGVDISNRSKIEVNTQISTFSTNPIGQFFCQFFIIRRSHGELKRKFSGITQTHGRTPFSIHANQQRNIRFGL